MSGYQTIKRYLGETSLERKCRILFGSAMIVLIGAAFWGVDRVAENLVKNETRRKGRDAIDLFMVVFHWDKWDSVLPKEQQPVQTDDMKKLLDQMRKDLPQDLLTQEYQAHVLKLDNDASFSLKSDIHSPADDDEARILESMKVQLAQWKQKHKENAASPPDPLKSTTDPGATTANRREHVGADFEPIFAERERADLSEYHYYQPVYWKEKCESCHKGITTEFAQSAAEVTPETTEKFRVVKVIMPLSDTKRAIHSTRAILISSALATVALAMTALYFIVKYVIVKPLKHIRDVSDNISKGDTTARAEIYTNDEFEQLAASFNKMLTNLTEQESQLRTVNEQLDAKVDQLAQVNMRLFETNRVKSDFLANMSHELRTPLNSIIGFSEVLQTVDSLTDKQKRYAQNIQKSGRQLLEMINDILDLAKMEAGRMDLRPTEFQIGGLVHAQCDLLRSLTEEKNIDLTVNIAPDLPPLYQDQAKVQQILTNLLSNAIKFTPDGGRIVVSAAPNDRGMLELSVADTGVGIAAADRDVIFEKFRQGTTVFNGDGLTREYSGTGLGLSIVKELCKLLGGEVGFDSELGRGSTFRVQLPWLVMQLPRPESLINARIDDLTKPRRADYAAVN